MPNPQPEFYGVAPARRRGGRARWLGKDGVAVGFMARLDQVPFWKLALFIVAWLLLAPLLIIIVGLVLVIGIDPPDDGMHAVLISGADVAIVAWVYIATVCKALGYRPGDRAIGRGAAGWGVKSAGMRNVGRVRALLQFAAEFVRGLVCWLVLAFCVWLGVRAIAYWLAP